MTSRSLASRYFLSTYLRTKRSSTLPFPASTRFQSTQASNVIEQAPSDPSLPQTTADAPPHPPASFYSMLRNSNFVKLGNLRRSPKPVVGKIVHIVDDDLYIDFGGKFKAVCSRPRNRGHLYRKGTEVIVALHDLEMTSRFLGAVRDTTLLEADATLLGLAPGLSSKGGEEVEAVGEEDEVEEQAVNLSDTLSYEIDNLFLDPRRMEGALIEGFFAAETSEKDDSEGGVAEKSDKELSDMSERIDNDDDDDDDKEDVKK